MMIAPIKKRVVVEASQDVAFSVFTEKMDSWWPKTHHIGDSPMTGSVLEPFVGGRWYATCEDGSEVNVGRVLRWNPFDSLMLNWQVDGNFKFNPELTTEVDVQFNPIDESTTELLFEHRNLDRLGGGAKDIEGMDHGWGFILDLYRQVAGGSKKMENDPVDSK